jgi:hypothetical protein
MLLWLGGASKMVVLTKRRGEGQERQPATTPALLCSTQRKKEIKRGGEKEKRNSNCSIYHLRHDTWREVSWRSFMKTKRWQGEIEKD